MLDSIKNQKLFFISLIGIVVTSLILTTTYAYQSIRVNYEESSKANLTVDAGVLDVSFTVSKDINLTNMPLLTNYKAADYIEMTIDNTNSTEDAAYEIYLRNLEYSSNLSTEDFRYTVFDVTNNILISEGNFNELSSTDFLLNLSDRTYDFITKGTTKTIRIYFWLKETTSNQNDLEKTYFKGNVEISSIYKSDMPEETTLAGTILTAYGGKDNITQITDFSVASTGLYKAEDDLGPSYYFRGDEINNYVQFGYFPADYGERVVGYYPVEFVWNEETQNEEYVRVGEEVYNSYYECINTGYTCESLTEDLSGKPMYWQIVRINGDDSIRLIFNGMSVTGNSTSLISSVPLSDINGENMIPSLLSYSSSWYNKCLKSYSNYLADGLFCYETTDMITNETITDANGDPLEEIGYFPAYYRVQNSNYNLKCVDSNGKLTVADGGLTLPIGLLSVDEASMGGSYLYNFLSGDLENGTNFATMSLASYSYENYSVYYAYENGVSYCDQSDMYCNLDIRPVINLDKYVEFTGSGRTDDPYVIKTD